jgi:hypothetical protein
MTQEGKKRLFEHYITKKQHDQIKPCHINSEFAHIKTVIGFD